MLPLLGHFGNGAGAHSSPGTNRTAVIVVINEHVTDKRKKATHLALQPQELTLILSPSTYAGVVRCTQVRDCFCSRCISRTKPSEQLRRFFVFMIRLLTYTPIKAAHSSSFFAFTRRRISSSLCSPVTQDTEHRHLSSLTPSLDLCPSSASFLFSLSLFPPRPPTFSPYPSPLPIPRTLKPLIIFRQPL